jgi:KUP system potassium uptake protein
VVARERFGWPAWRAGALCGLFLAADLGFLGATLFKIPDGGWFPLVVAAVVFTMLTTWRSGRRLVGERLLRGRLPLTEFLGSLAHHPPLRTPGASAFLFSTPGITPPALISALRHTDSLHEQVLVVSIVTEEVPRVLPARRTEITDLGLGFHRVVLHFGFMEDPDIPRALAHQVVMKLGIDLGTLSYFLGRESLRVTSRPGMTRWREHLFTFQSRNATSAANYFHLPYEQTVELGITIEL